MTQTAPSAPGPRSLRTRSSITLPLRSCRSGLRSSEIPVRRGIDTSPPPLSRQQPPRKPRPLSTTQTCPRRPLLPPYSAHPPSSGRPFTPETYRPRRGGCLGSRSPEERGSKSAETWLYGEQPSYSTPSLTLSSSRSTGRCRFHHLSHSSPEESGHGRRVGPLTDRVRTQGPDSGPNP